MNELVEGATGFSAELNGKRDTRHAPVYQKFCVL
jgi:hypothetical protein